MREFGLREFGRGGGSYMRLPGVSQLSPGIVSGGYDNQKGQLHTYARQFSDGSLGQLNVRAS